MNNDNKKHEVNNTAALIGFIGLSGLMIYTIYMLVESVRVSTVVL